jgi:hypothetical protein
MAFTSVLEMAADAGRGQINQLLVDATGAYPAAFGDK